jgi:ESX secretion system protein EccE
VPVGPLVAWQVGLGLLAVGFAYQEASPIPLVIGIVVLLAVAVFTLLYLNGRPLWRWVGVWRAHRKRNSDARAGAPHDPALAPLREWMPKFEITSVAGRRGSTDVGVIHDGTGYVFLLGPSQEDLISSADPVTVPLKALAALGDAEGVRLASAQLIVRTLPAPSPSLGQYGQQIAQSYLEINTAGAPATIAWWIAVRLEPGWAGSALTLDGDDIDAVRRAIRTAIGWATKVLSSEGVPCRALGETEVRDVLSLTLSIDPHYVPASVRARRTNENWRGWTCDGVAHATGWVRSWPRAGLPGASRLLAAMAALPVASTASLTFSWSAENLLRSSSFVRIGADNPKNARAAFRQLTRLSSRGRVTVNRLDGEHVPGVLATIPLGIGAR